MDEIEQVLQKVLEIHKDAMEEHKLERRRARRWIIAQLMFCAIVTASSAILIFNPPPGFAPPAGYRFPGETIFLLSLFGGTFIALLALLAWLQVLMSRQTQRTARLIVSFYELGRRVERDDKSGQQVPGSPRL